MHGYVVLLPVPPYNQNSAFILEKKHVKKICKKHGINKQRFKKKKRFETVSRNWDFLKPNWSTPIFVNFSISLPT